MPNWAKYLIVFLIGYWVCSVGGPQAAAHIIAGFLGGV